MLVPAAKREGMGFDTFRCPVPKDIASQWLACAQREAVQPLAPSRASTPEALGLAQADAVDDGRVVQLVTDDAVLLPQEDLKDA